MLARALWLAAALLGACGSDAGPEQIVIDATLGVGVPTLLGVDDTAVYWSVSGGAGPVRIGGAALSSAPTAGKQLGEATGPIVQVGDHVVYASEAAILRVAIETTPSKAETAIAEALGESLDPMPVLVWTEGPMVSWGNSDLRGSVTLSRITRCDHLRVTDTSIYVAADGATGRRLFRIDRQTDTVVPLTASSTHAASFPGGGMAGAEYRGRIVGADAEGALWLVEEFTAGATTPGRAILVSVPERGATSVLLENVRGAGAFFTTDDAFYWQERDALLTAPRAGGAAAIAFDLPGTAGALAAGFVYVTADGAISRLPLD